MKFGRGMFRLVAGLVMTCALGAATVYSQANPAGQATGQKPQMSEEAFKNIQVLRGIPVKEFMETMGFFAASLSLNCVDCHGEASGSDHWRYTSGSCGADNHNCRSGGADDGGCGGRAVHSRKA